VRKKKGRNLFIAGLLIFIASYLLPVDLLNSFTNLKPTGLTSMFICPIIGLIGAIISFRERDKLFILLNLLLILLFPLAMFTIHIIGV